MAKSADGPVIVRNTHSQKMIWPDLCALGHPLVLEAGEEVLYPHDPGEVSHLAMRAPSSKDKASDDADTETLGGS